MRVIPHMSFSSYLKIIAIVFLNNFYLLSSQTPSKKNISIHIYEAETQEPIPFASVYWHGTTYGFQTDFEGKISTSIARFQADSLRIVFGGLQTKIIKIDTHQNQLQLNILMEREIIKSEAVTINLGINPAIKWVDLAIEKRNQNNFDESVNYQCEVFSKTVLSVNNLSKKIERLKVGKQINALFDTLEYITGDTEKAVLPVFLSNTISTYAHQKGGTLEREDIHASRVYGVGITDGSTISQLTGSSFARYNIYNSRLQILGKGVISPIAPQAKLFYNYKLIDVDKTHSLRWFVVKVSPKNPKDILFNGLIWIEEQTGAITRLHLEINEASQINFLERLRITQEFSPSSFNTPPYALANSRSLVDVSEFTENTIGFLATNLLTYRKYQLVDEFPTGYFDQALIMEESALKRSDSFWTAVAPIKASPFEEKVIHKIEAVREIPTIDRASKALNFLVNGYLTGNKWPVELGPYYYLALLNPLEGFRTRWGFRTSNYLTKKWQFEGFGAYGFKDQRFKYGLKLSWYPNLKKGTTVKISHTEDTELLGFVDNENMTSGDALILALNMFSSNSLVYSQNTYFSYEQDIVRGLSFQVKLNHRIYDLPESQKIKLGWFENPNSQNISTHLNNSTIYVKLTYEPKVFYVVNDYRRTNWAQPGPKYSLSFQKALPQILGSSYDYTKLSFLYNYNYIWAGIGRTQMKITANKLIGDVPFPLLNIPLGNQAIVYNTRAFNQMNLFEFVTDQNIEAIFEHHFNGLFFNRIPVLNKWGWREIINAKLIEGSLSASNRSLIPTEIQIKNNITPIKSFNYAPYVEVGFGVENIFKFLRVDAVWRLTHRNSQNNFGVKLSSYIDF